MESNTAPWAKFIEVNDKTYELRLRFFIENGTSICDYFIQYVPYAEPEGYTLVSNVYFYASL